MDFRPFTPLRPAPEVAGRLVAPPYDVVSTQEARALAGDEPLSFLRVSRAELELPDGADPYAPDVYLRAYDNLQRLVHEGALVRESRPSYAVYRQTRGNHAQVGVVGLASVAEYEAGLVKKHELTRPDKEHDRTRHIDTTSAQTGPVFLATRDDGPLEALLVATTLTAPDIEARMHDGVLHEAWLVPADSPRGERLAACLAAAGAAYIADGHHRAASAANVARLRRARGQGAGAWDHFLAVLFPARCLAILPYNRVLRDNNGLDEPALLAALERVCEVGPPGASPLPRARHHVAMYLCGAWRELTFSDVVEDDPIGSLDVALLQDRVLGPILGVTDPRRDPRIEFVGGVRGVVELTARAGRHGVAFSLYPTALAELCRVADAGLIMPPKSTWFEPKLADGMFVHTFGGVGA
jgi:uncharacterized protein (DUF1015 family)